MVSIFLADCRLGCDGGTRQAGGTVLVARHKLNQRVHLPGTGAIRLFVTRLG